jgi:hypothetical protein
MAVNTNNDKRWETDDAQYLRDLSKRLMGVPVCHGVDQYDAERVYNLAKQAVKPKRKVIQIAVAVETATTFYTLYALCDDGSLWARIEAPHKELVWQMLNPIPQDD